MKYDKKGGVARRPQINNLGKDKQIDEMLKALLIVVLVWPIIVRMIRHRKWELRYQFPSQNKQTRYGVMFQEVHSFEER
jgi:membrane protein YdbS with pleckstrin-like domain